MASAYISRLFDEYRRAAKIGADVMDAAASENRDLTPAELEQRDKAFADVTRLKAEMDKVSHYEDLRQAGDTFRHAVAPIVERASGSNVVTVRDLIRGVNANGFAAAEFSGIETRALATSTNTVETAFSDLVIHYARAGTPMLRPDVVTYVERQTGSPLIYPKITADVSVGGTLTAEAAGITLADPTFGSFTLNPYKYAVITVLSSELVQDAAINIEQLVATSHARELASDIGTALTTGDGSSKPQGFIGIAANGGTATGTSATLGTYFGPDDLINLFYTLPAPARDKGAWMANATSLAAIRKSSDADGNKLWQASLVAGAPETVLGRPIYENAAMASGSAAKAVAFGDFSTFVVQATPWRVEASKDAYFGTDQIGLRSILRVDSDGGDAGAIYYLVNAAV